jgi:hypothetical protein
LTQTAEHVVWCEIVARCTNPRHKSYADYGGRGITVCQRWMRFETFISDMGPRPSGKHTVERVDNDAGYQPENCVWALQAQQAVNKRNNRHITHDGQTLTVSQWAAAVGLKAATIYTRLHNGWSPAAAITTPLLRRR